MEEQSKGMEATPSPQMPIPVPTKRTGVLGKVLVGLFIFVLLAVATGLGYWDYTLNQSLTLTNSQIADWQSKYETLQNENKQLNLDFTAAKDELKKATADLNKTQGETKETQKNADVVDTRMKFTLQLFDVANALIIEQADFDVVEQKIVATKDAKLLELWEKVKSGQRQEDLDSFLFYLFRIISENVDKEVSY